MLFYCDFKRDIVNIRMNHTTSDQSKKSHDAENREQKKLTLSEAIKLVERVELIMERENLTQEDVVPTRK
jgi:hypothetical protein